MEIFLLHIKTQNNTIAALGLKKGPGCLQGPSVCSLQFPPGAPGLPASKNMQGWVFCYCDQAYIWSWSHCCLYLQKDELNAENEFPYWSQ